MNKPPRKNDTSRGERDTDDRRGQRGRATPRGERGDSRSSRGRDDRQQRQRRRDDQSSSQGKKGKQGEGAPSRGARGDERPTRRTDSSPQQPQRGRDGRRSAKAADSQGHRGGGQRPASGAARAKRATEKSLSPRARASLRRLREDYDPKEDGSEDSGAPRDTYADVAGGIRLQKALAQAGVASRRASEELIAQGRVSIDGQVVRRFGARVDPQTSEIRVDGMRVATAPDLLYFALNKPRGVISTMSDPEGRPTLADYAGQTQERLFHVGRLDTDTEGLILLTNDGELANRLTHPSYKVSKTYLANVVGPVSQRELRRQLREGVTLEDGPVDVDSIRVVENGEARALLEIRLHEGRKHIVRRLLDALGHPVMDLARTQVGPVGLHTLKPGTMRALTAQEVSELYTSAGM
ncbi:pseudouridine synthase [Salinactinospora qingdaonensis]|uniref:Pseudouridine synthase n=1 Tax=Salinactinospora qingdaonensis TaxID=702744 RepID=A0ABP7FMX0_9ACTN